MSPDPRSPRVVLGPAAVGLVAGLGLAILAWKTLNTPSGDPAAPEIGGFIVFGGLGLIAAVGGVFGTTILMAGRVAEGAANRLARRSPLARVSGATADAGWKWLKLAIGLIVGIVALDLAVAAISTNVPAETGDDGTVFLSLIRLLVAVPLGYALARRVAWARWLIGYGATLNGGMSLLAVGFTLVFGRSPELTSLMLIYQFVSLLSYAIVAYILLLMPSVQLFFDQR